jgi:hypothetical protein
LGAVFFFKGGVESIAVAISLTVSGYRLIGLPLGFLSVTKLPSSKPYVLSNYFLFKHQTVAFNGGTFSEAVRATGNCNVSLKSLAMLHARLGVWFGTFFKRVLQPSSRVCWPHAFLFSIRATKNRMAEIFGFILLLLFPVIAFGGWCYQKGEQHERQRQREAWEKRVKDLEDAGYDATPHYYPKEDDN